MIWRSLVKRSDLGLFLDSNIKDIGFQAIRPRRKMVSQKARRSGSGLHEAGHNRNRKVSRDLAL
jgi:hypothetical protein